MREGPQTNGLFYMSGSESWSRGFGPSFCLCSNVIKPRQCHEQSRLQAERLTKNIPPRPRRVVARCAHSQEPHEEEVGEDGEHFEDQGRGSVRRRGGQMPPAPRTRRWAHQGSR